MVHVPQVVEAEDRHGGARQVAGDLVAVVRADDARDRHEARGERAGFERTERRRNFVLERRHLVDDLDRQPVQGELAD